MTEQRTGPGLFVSDVDGTLVTPDKAVTPAAIAAALDLHAAGVPFTLVSSRPPRGMAQVIAATGVTLPFAAFNGGSLVGPGLKLIEAHRLSVEAATGTLALLEAQGIEAFVFADDAWLLRDPNGAKVGRERRTVGFDPTVVTGFDAVIDRIDKIVGVSDDLDKVASCEKLAQQKLGERASAARSQPYYLDVTHPNANKGAVVLTLAKLDNIAPEEIATIGDMPNDVLMFRKSGFSIAMGNASDEVKSQASVVTDSNQDEGFAKAVRKFILKAG